MKGTGIVRNLDALGRITLPREIRRTFDLNIADGMEIFVEENSIILKKYQPECVLCGEAKDVTSFNNKNICQLCISKIKNQL